MENQLFFFTIFVSLISLILMKAWRRSKPTDTIPGPWKLPFIGNLHQFVGVLLHHRLTDMAKKYGPIMHLKIGEHSFIVVSSSELAKDVVKNHDILFSTRPHNKAADVIFYNGRNVANSPYGDHWRQMRKICTLELLTVKRVQSFRSIREEEVFHMIKSLTSNAGVPANLSKMLATLTYDIISRTAFGKGQKKDAFVPIVDEIASALGEFGLADLFPSIKLLEVISGKKTKLQKLHQEADTVLEAIIKEHRQKIKSENSEADDLVDVLLNVQNHGTLDKPLAQEDIKAVLMDMFIAGTETSSTTILWVMSELVRHPKIIEKAQAEVRRVFHGKERVDEKNLHELTYLNMVVKESLRLHPAPLLHRENQEKTSIGRYTIPEKTEVLVNVRAIARDPHFWAEPEKYYPERFLNSSVDFKGTNLEFMPFGAGRRMCPGIHYGMSIVELVLATLLYHFDWKVPGGLKPEDLDMAESFGLGVKRTNDLCLIPIPVNPKP